MDGRSAALPGDVSASASGEPNGAARFFQSRCLTAYLFHMQTNATAAASQFASGQTRVAKNAVLVPFSIRVRLGGTFRAREYVDAHTARTCGAKNIRPDGSNLALVADWPKHLVG